MSSLRATFNIQSIGYYPKGKAIYLTLTSLSAGRETQKVSVLLDRTEANLTQLGNLIRDQNSTIDLLLDTTSRTFIQDRDGRNIVRFRASKIEKSCERSNVNFFSPTSN